MEKNLTFKNSFGVEMSNSNKEPVILSYSSHGTEARITVPYSDIDVEELSGHFVKLMGCAGFAKNQLEEAIYERLQKKLDRNE